MRWTAELLDLFAPRSCGGCGSTGALICEGCAQELRAGLSAPGVRVEPAPVPAGFVATWAQGSYAGALGQVLRRHKDEDRLDLTAWCARYLRGALAACLRADPVVAQAVRQGRLTITAIPSSNRALRKRGRDPLWDITVQATRQDLGVGLPPARTLRIVRPTLDQAGLDAPGRARNLAGAMTVSPSTGARVAGGVVVIVDDIVTTGSTLVEAARALRRAGASHVVACTIAATRRAGYGRRMKGRQDLDDTDDLNVMALARRSAGLPQFHPLSSSRGGDHPA